MVTKDVDSGTREVQIDDRLIGDGHETFIIAEAGINHNGDLDLAKQLVSEAAAAGADAVKFQTYTTENRVEENSPVFDVLKECELNADQWKELFEYARTENVIFFSTAFDAEAVSLLDELGVELFKAASFHITHKSLLRAIANTGRPVIFSRGMATLDEIEEAVSLFDDHDTPHALLHCVSSYPTDDTDANLNIIGRLRELFDCPIGYSDHTIGAQVPALSVATGGSVIEKHFTLDSEMDGPDHELSAEPAEFAEMVEEIRQVEAILGHGDIRRLSCEADATQFRIETE